VTDPKSVPDVMRLYGYPGASSEEAHERLYLSPDLTNYVILHRMAIPAEQDPHGAVCWWVKKDSALIYKMAPAAQAMAHYFTGAIQAGAAGMAAALQCLRNTSGDDSTGLVPDSDGGFAVCELRHSLHRRRPMPYAMGRNLWDRLQRRRPVFDARKLRDSLHH
jgi:hypothetical protein